MAYPVFIFGYGDWDVYDGDHWLDVIKDVMKEVGVIGNLLRQLMSPLIAKGAMNGAPAQLTLLSVDEPVVRAGGRFRFGYVRRERQSPALCS